ncbi:hypothetical protein BP6252_08975 [Coleophoma cylindrospora]|uniref:Uncharacterized protein n=1 Tax=Coleophoma cylindrospora TaxID=1849047 RepID=A0A3D8R0L5_9HELO|nr:hypothetical protein BP6252_08975 [Coleophoma cylindrospora]
MFQHRDIQDFERFADQEGREICSRGFSGALSLPHAPLIGLPKEIVQPMNDRATDFFLSAHTFRDSGFIRGYYEYLPGFRSDPKTDITLSTTLNAVALTAYAYAFQYPDLLHEARRLFVSALHLVNNALSSSQEAIKDSTIISIMLFGTFSILTCKSQQSLSDCALHSGGTTTIIKLRGYRQWKTRSQLQLLQQLCSGILQKCIYKTIRVPREVIELRRHAETYLDTNDPAWKLSNVIIKLAALRADIKELLLCDHFSIVDAAMKLDAEFTSLEQEMSVQWHFETVFTKEQSELVFGTYYHVYPDLWEASIWNSLRTCRLLLHEEIANQLKDVLLLFPQPPISNAAANYQLSVTTIQQLSLDICASVPQYSSQLLLHLRSLLTAKEYVMPEPLHFPNTPATEKIPSTAGVYFLFWPLLRAGQVTESEVQRNWVIRQSRLIGRMTGIQQAFTLANVLERGEELTP